jgi:hypothetical protein
MEGVEVGRMGDGGAKTYAHLSMHAAEAANVFS